jgi:hypothetical protein
MTRFSEASVFPGLAFLQEVLGCFGLAEAVAKFWAFPSEGVTFIDAGAVHIGYLDRYGIDVP